MLLTPFGAREWGLILFLGTAAAVGTVVLGWWIATVLVVLAMLAGLAFFRDPLRRVPTASSPGELLAPADGLVSAIERGVEHPAIDGPAAVVRIYLSVFDVHVNRSPCAAEVLSTQHQPGRHLDVRNPDSARENEWLLMSLRRSADGTRIAVRQIAGLVARRIVCAVSDGRRLDRGERYGMIKFGSSTELIVPDRPDLEIPVAIGDRVAAGLTPLAVLPTSPAAPAAGRQDADGADSGQAPAPTEATPAAVASPASPAAIPPKTD